MLHDSRVAPASHLLTATRTWYPEAARGGIFGLPVLLEATGGGVPVRRPRPSTSATRRLAIKKEPEVQKEEAIELDGEVVQVLGNSNFRVKLTEDHSVLARIAGRMRRARIRVMTGDKVKVELSPYDLERGRIVWRYR